MATSSETAHIYVFGSVTSRQNCSNMEIHLFSLNRYWLNRVESCLFNLLVYFRLAALTSCLSETGECLIEIATLQKVEPPPSLLYSNGISQTDRSKAWNQFLLRGRGAHPQSACAASEERDGGGRGRLLIKCLFRLVLIDFLSWTVPAGTLV